MKIDAQPEEQLLCYILASYSVQMRIACFNLVLVNMILCVAACKLGLFVIFNPLLDSTLVIQLYVLMLVCTKFRTV